MCTWCTAIEQQLEQCVECLESQDDRAVAFQQSKSHLLFGVRHCMAFWRMPHLAVTSELPFLDEGKWHYVLPLLQGLWASTTQQVPKLLSKPWMDSRLAWSVWRCNWRDPRMPTDHTEWDPHPGTTTYRLQGEVCLQHMATRGLCFAKKNRVSFGAQCRNYWKSMTSWCHWPNMPLCSLSLSALSSM